MVAPHFKNNFLKLVRMLALFSLCSFSESLNPIMQVCQMDLGICYWNKTTTLSHCNKVTGLVLSNEMFCIMCARKKDSPGQLDQEPPKNFEILDT